MIEDNPYWGHVLNKRFGTQVDPYEGLIELAKQVDGKLKGFALDAVLKEHYETTFGIVNVDDPFRPLALVGENPRDGNYYMLPIFNKLKRYKLFNVLGVYGLNPLEFLSLPRELSEWILDDLREDEDKRMKAKAAAEAKARQIESQNKGKVAGDPTVIIPPMYG